MSASHPDVPRPHVVSLVLNSVIGDSRVLKTAQAALNGGYRATIVGLGAEEGQVEHEIGGVRVILVPNPVSGDLGSAWRHRADRPVWLFVEHAVDRMLPVIEELQPDILHSHDMLGLRVGSAATRLLAMQGRVIPWVHDIHEFVRGLTNFPDSYRLQCEEYERRCLRQADGLLTVSERLSQEVASFYRLPQPPTVVFNATYKKAAPAEAPEIRSAIGLAADVPLVVYIGVAKPTRGCETIGRALASIPVVHVCFVSNSSYTGELKKIAQSLGVGHRVHTHPYVPVDEVSSFIRTADIGIHAMVHYPNGEVAMPNKLFEYLQAGLPLAVSDVAEMKRFVDSTGVGEAFVAEDPDSCANAMRKILADPQCYRRCITDELQMRFSWQEQEKKILEMYRSLLARYEAPAGALNLVDGSQADAGRVVKAVRTDFPGEPVAWIGPNEPVETVEFFIDPTEGETAGLLTRLIGRFRTLRLHGPTAWPSAVDLFALKASGITIWPAPTADGLQAERLFAIIEEGRRTSAERTRRTVMGLGLAKELAEARSEAAAAALGKEAERRTAAESLAASLQVQADKYRKVLKRSLLGRPASAPVSMPATRKRLFDPPYTKIPARIIRRFLRATLAGPATGAHQ